MPLQRRDFTPAGFPAYIVWWLGDETQALTTPLGFDALPVPEQVRELGVYLCSGTSGAHVEVRLSWHAGLNCVIVTGYADFGGLKRQTGARFSTFETLPEAVTFAREEIRTLHRWMNAGGDYALPPCLEVDRPAAPRNERVIRQDIERLEGQMERMNALTRAEHIGSKAAIATRNARREWIGVRLYKLRRELDAVTAA